MFVTMEDDALKVCLLFCAVCLHFFFKYIYILFLVKMQDVGECGANAHVVLKVPDVNRLPDHFGAKVGHGTHPWNYVRIPISP